MSRTVALVGAGGFIATNLCRSLLADGVPVRAVSRSWLVPPEPALERALTADLEENAGLADLLSGSTAVVMLSHGLRPGSPLEESSAPPVKDAGVLLRVILGCVKNGSKLVYISSGGTVYGPNVTEPTPKHAPCEPITIYGGQTRAQSSVVSHI